MVGPRESEAEWSTVAAKLECARRSIRIAANSRFKRIGDQPFALSVRIARCQACLPRRAHTRRAQKRPSLQLRRFFPSVPPPYLANAGRLLFLRLLLCFPTPVALLFSVVRIYVEPASTRAGSSVSNDVRQRPGIFSHTKSIELNSASTFIYLRLDFTSIFSPFPIVVEFGCLQAPFHVHFASAKCIRYRPHGDADC